MSSKGRQVSSKRREGALVVVYRGVWCCQRGVRYRPRDVKGPQVSSKERQEYRPRGVSCRVKGRLVSPNVVKWASGVSSKGRKVLRKGASGVVEGASGVVGGASGDAQTGPQKSSVVRGWGLRSQACCGRGVRCRVERK